jgi:hypothetical protein
VQKLCTRRQASISSATSRARTPQTPPDEHFDFVVVEKADAAFHRRPGNRPGRGDDDDQGMVKRQR